MLLSLLVLSAILAISFSISAILFVEIRSSSDILKGETAFYAASAVTEEALFKIKRQVPKCEGAVYTNCFNGYPTKLGQVELGQPGPVETSTSTPIFNDIIPTSNNNFLSAARFALFNPNNVSGGSGYGKIKITYLDSNSNDPLVVYMCEYDPSYSGDYASPGPACSDPSAENSYWYPNGNVLNNKVINPGSGALEITLDPSKQQELVLFNGSNAPSGPIYVQIESYADQAGTLAKGIPLVGETSVDVTAKTSGLTRKVRVNIPVAASGYSGVNYSMEYDGVNDGVLVPANAALNMNRFTLEAWVYPRSTDSNYQTLIVKNASDGSNRNFALFFLTNSTRIQFSFRTNCNLSYQFYDSPTSLPLNQWTHVAATYDGAALKLYLNGVLDGQVASNQTPCLTSQPVYIGGYVNWSPIDGFMDEVRIWNYARTQSDIDSNRFIHLTGSESGLVGYYRFDSGSGTTAVDSSATNNNGSLMSTPVWSGNIPYY